MLSVNSPTNLIRGGLTWLTLRRREIGTEDLQLVVILDYFLHAGPTIVVNFI